jgi:hypothetical protein
MLPGEGELPVQALVEAVPPDVLLGIEAPSQRRRDQGLPADAYADRAMRSLKLLLAGIT